MNMNIYSKYKVKYNCYGGEKDEKIDCVVKIYDDYVE